MILTLTLTERLEPTFSYSRSCRTRRSLACRCNGRSPISSRKMVPPLANSKRPWRDVTRAGERAFFVAEQFRFEKRFGKRRAVDFDQRTARSWAG